jgi:thioredoxin reductase (NADPH)
MLDVVVIGSGPAGLSAALYAARANLATKVIAGPQIGGQVSLTWEIDNYLGFPETLSGADLTARMVQHAEKFGAEVVLDEVTGVDFTASPFKVTTYGGELEARAVVVAAGASSKKLAVPGEEDFTGRGVSYCATCDGAFFKGHNVLVVGGGDSALEEALFLTRFADTVRIVHRRDHFRAGPQLQERVAANPKISYVWNTVVDEIRGNGKVDEVAVHNIETQEPSVLNATGVFVFIGHFPNSDVFHGALVMDHHGYIQVDERMMTSVPGVFACGEIADPVWKQVASSVGQGAQAGMSVQSWLGASER